MCRADIIRKLRHLFLKERNSGRTFAVKFSTVRPPDLISFINISLAVSHISTAHAALPETSGKLLCSQISPTKINVSFVSNLIHNNWFVVLLSPIGYHFCCLINIHALNTYMCDPGAVMVIKRNAVVDRTKVSVRVIFNHNFCISFPVFNGFLWHKIVLICHRPPDVFEMGKTFYHVG